MRTLAAATAFLAAAEAFVPITQSSPKLIVQRAYSRSRVAPMMARKPFMAGNWKLNPATVDEATSLAKAVAAATTSPDVDVAVVAPFPFLVPVKQALAGSKVALGAQDLYTEDKGAFTGAVATSMIKSTGAQWVLCGHSERRA